MKSNNEDNNNNLVSKKDVIAKDAIDENNETESDDGLMNVNVKERRQNLMEMLNSPVNLKTQANVRLIQFTQLIIFLSL